MNTLQREILEYIKCTDYSTVKLNEMWAVVKAACDNFELEEVLSVQFI